MALALTNLQTFLAVYLHPVFDRALDTVCLALIGGTGQNHLWIYHDLYIWVQIEEALAKWSGDVRTRNWSSMSPMLSLSGPEGVARLLHIFMVDLVQSADHSIPDVMRRWTAEPHLTFYSSEGQLSGFRGRGMVLVRSTMHAIRLR